MMGRMMGRIVSFLLLHMIGTRVRFNLVYSVIADLSRAPPSQVKRKIKKAFCPPEVVEGNPIVDYTKHIIFGYFGSITINCDGVSE